MGRKRKKLPVIERLEIIDVGAEGKSIAKHNDVVVFVAMVIPGDIVDVQLTRKRKNYMEAFPVKFHKYSEGREKPFCEHFGVCGGCKWQNLPYEKQLFYKQKQVVDQLKRIGNLSDSELNCLNPIMSSPKTTHYRNKLEFTFSNNKWITREELESGIDIIDRNALGFHIPKMFDKILDISNCYLQPDPSNGIREWFRKYTEEKNLAYFDLRNKTGLLRNLIIRTSNTGEVMVIVAFYDNDQNAREDMLDSFLEAFPVVTSLYFVVNQKANDTILDQELILFKGKEDILEEMENLSFNLGPKSFYQTNSDQAYNLYKVARDFAGLNGNEIVYDLYTGTGTIANFVASKTLKTIGIEVVPEAIDDAVENSKRNGIQNTQYISGDIKDIFNIEFMEENGRPDVVIMDPPRAGVHKNVINALNAVLPQKIVYVSCNPATQARDISLLGNNYQVKRIQPVDMFPHTHHVENVILLEKK